MSKNMIKYLLYDFGTLYLIRIFMNINESKKNKKFRIRGSNPARQGENLVS